MRNKYFWLACIWTLFLTVTCLFNFKLYHAVDESFSLPYKDKYVHFTYYFIFTVLWSLCLKQAGVLKGKKIRQRVFLSAVGYGILIEICQGVFTNDRSPDVTDAIANTLGSATAILLLWLLQRKKEQIVLL